MRFNAPGINPLEAMPGLATQTPGARVPGAWPQTQPSGPFEQQLANLTPEQVDEWFGPLLQRQGLVTRRGDLERQMAMANELRGSHSADSRTTGWGAGLAGIGDVFNKTLGGYRAGQAESGLQANTKEMTNTDFYKSPLARALLLRGFEGQ